MPRESLSEVEQRHSETHATLIDQLSEGCINYDFARDMPDIYPTQGNIIQTASLVHRIANLQARYEQLGGIEDLNEVIVLGREALSLWPPELPDRSSALTNLGMCLSSRYDRLGGIADLNEAIVLEWEVLSLCPPGHPHRSSSLTNLATYLSSRYEQLKGVNDLNEALALNREALSLCPPGHPDRSTSLNNLAVDLFSRYNHLGGINDLNEALVLDREALSLYPPGHPDRSNCLTNVAVHLSSRYDQLGEIDDLNEALILDREALSLRPPGHPDRSTSLTNLAVDLSSRYNQLGEINDLNEAIVLDREVLSLYPPGHPKRSRSMTNLAVDLSSRYNQLGGVDDLNEILVLDREALSLCPPGHPDRSTSLNNLTAHLSSRYNQLGGIDDLNEAIVLGREAHSLYSPEHPDRSSVLINLANHLSFRYKQLGGIDDLNEALVLQREALSLCPPGNPGRSFSLTNLGICLSSRYQRLGVINDLNEALSLQREALSFRPPGHPNRSTSLTNLAVDLFSRYKQLGEIEDLNEALALDREALSLRPPGHPHRSSSLINLAAHLWFRYDQLGELHDLNEALVLDREALSLCPPGHPERSMSLTNLIAHLLSWYALRRGSGDPNAASEDEAELFSLYTQLAHVSQTVSSADLSTAKLWVHAAERFQHPTTLLAYETALRLLVQYLATLPSLPHHLGLLKSVSSSFSVDAFSACLRNKSPAEAVELLEQGRAVFWSQLTRLRSPLDNVIKSGPQGEVLADEFTRLTSLIRNALDAPEPNQHDRVCRLNVELQDVVSKIRDLPGLSLFLLPLPFSDLQMAAREGPIIIMNASDYGCDALVVPFDKDPIHIPLPVTKDDVRKFSSRLRTLRRDAKWMEIEEIEKDFRIFLRDLWEKLVSHIASVLQGICPHSSRVWWCPTAEFSLLPLHAADPYRKGQKGFSDLYVSSYTTTLTALIRARRSGLVSEKKRFIAIGQAAAKGASKLSCVGPELDNISRLVGGLATFTRIEGEDACISNVADELARNEWVHFACHGVPNQKEPFESAFALRDGSFTIQRINQCRLRNPEFAYLSACHTTVGDEESPDEAIHLAAAMQFAGFRSVIGTMSAVNDAQTNELITEFYKLMIDDSGCLDYTRAARALRIAVRKAKISIDQRILYVHLGA